MRNTPTNLGKELNFKSPYDDPRRLKFWVYCKKKNVSTARLIAHEKRHGRIFVPYKLEGAVRRQRNLPMPVGFQNQAPSGITEDGVREFFRLMEADLHLPVTKACKQLGFKKNVIYARCLTVGIDLADYLKRRKARKEEQWAETYFDDPKATHATIAKDFGAGEKTVWRVLNKVDRKKAPIRRMGFRAFDAFKRNTIYLLDVTFFKSKSRYKLGITAQTLKRRFKNDIIDIIKSFKPIGLWSTIHLNAWCIERQLLFLLEDKVNEGPEGFGGRKECFTPNAELKTFVQGYVDYSLKALSFRTSWLCQQPCVGLDELKSVHFLEAFDPAPISSLYKEFMLDVMRRRNLKLDLAIEEHGLTTVIWFETQQIDNQDGEETLGLEAGQIEKSGIDGKANNNLVQSLSVALISSLMTNLTSATRTMNAITFGPSQFQISFNDPGLSLNLDVDHLVFGFDNGGLVVKKQMLYASKWCYPAVGVIIAGFITYAREQRQSVSIQAEPYFASLTLNSQVLKQWTWVALESSFEALEFLFQTLETLRNQSRLLPLTCVFVWVYSPYAVYNNIVNPHKKYFVPWFSLGWSLTALGKYHGFTLVAQSFFIPVMLSFGFIFEALGYSNESLISRRTALDVVVWVLFFGLPVFLPGCIYTPGYDIATCVTYMTLNIRFMFVLSQCTFLCVFTTSKFLLVAVKKAGHKNDLYSYLWFQMHYRQD